MKNILHIVLSAFLILATTGIRVSMHYCGGSLQSISIYEDAEPCCDSSCGCCENSVVHYQFKTDFENPVQLENPKTQVSETLIEFSIFEDSFNGINSNLFVYNHLAFDLPPPPLGERLSMFQSFLC